MDHLMSYSNTSPTIRFLSYSSMSLLVQAAPWESASKPLLSGLTFEWMDGKARGPGTRIGTWSSTSEVLSPAEDDDSTRTQLITHTCLFLLLHLAFSLPFTQLNIWSVLLYSFILHLHSLLYSHFTITMSISLCLANAILFWFLMSILIPGSIPFTTPQISTWEHPHIEESPLLEPAYGPPDHHMREAPH